MKKVLLGLSAIVIAVLLFAGGVYASQWLSFTGDDEVSQSHEDIDEILEILQRVYDGKLTAEEALAKAEEALRKIEDERPPGLNKKIKDLEDKVAELEGTIGNKDNRITELETQVTQLEGTIELRDNEIAGLKTQLENAGDPEYIAHLEAELTRANEEVNKLSTKTTNAVEEARKYDSGE